MTSDNSPNTLSRHWILEFPTRASMTNFLEEMAAISPRAGQEEYDPDELGNDLITTFEKALAADFDTLFTAMVDHVALRFEPEDREFIKRALGPLCEVVYSAMRWVTAKVPGSLAPEVSFLRWDDRILKAMARVSITREA